MTETGGNKSYFFNFAENNGKCTEVPELVKKNRRKFDELVEHRDFLY